MQLEQTLEMYQPIQTQGAQERQRIYTIVDLENLSASALYMADKLYIKDYMDGSSLHIHEVDGKITGANIRGKGEQKGVPLSNYQATMLDILSGKVTERIKSGS